MTANKKQTTASKVASVISIPGYEIKDLLGRGGMAMVYLAVQESIGREVALKVLSPDHTDETFSERFLREARIASQLSHPNIITVFDAGIHNDIHYMSMEYIKGKSFNEARDLLTRKQKVKVIKEIAQALDFASKNGFLHRDIKPENILLHQDGRAILTDFGIAKTNDVSKGLTETGKILGTPYFMSPEQTKGLQIDHRTDIYSLGVVLFQALAGYVPYDGPSLVSICIKHLSDPIPQLPKGLEVFQQIINTCMSKKPEHRYQHASELYEALNKISDKELDSIDANAKALKKAGQDHNAETLVDTDLSQKLPQTKISKKKTSRPVTSTSTTSKKIRNNPVSTHKYIKPSPLPNIADSEDFKNLNRRKKRILMLLIILAIAIGYYQRIELTRIWNTQGKPLAKQYLPNEIKNYLFTDTKIKKVPPVKVKTPKAKLSAEQIELNKIFRLKESLNKIPSNAVLLSEIYDKNLSLNPDNKDTINSINELKQWYIYHATFLINQKDYNSADKTITTLSQFYPEIIQSDAYISLQDKLDMGKVNEPHLQKSRVYFAVNALNAPEGANALEELKTVLNNDEYNEEALAGIRKIADHFKLKSRTQINNKELFKALNSVNAGLQAIHNDQELLSLQKEIKTSINSKNDINKIIRQAKKQLNNGNSITPSGTSAFDLYQNILSIDINNKEAKNGLLLIRKKIVKKANSYVNQNKFLEANKTITTASKLFPNSNDIKSLKIKLQKEMDAILPIVPKIKISNLEFSEITPTTMQKIKIGELLHIGFEYNNFTQNKTNIKVNIYNGLEQNKNTINQKLIIQKSITILGKNGTHYFSVKLPKSGIINGNYSFELMFGESRLIKANLFGLH